MAPCGSEAKANGGQVPCYAGGRQKLIQKLIAEEVFTKIDTSGSAMHG
jgi:hypothetical protein